MKKNKRVIIVLSVLILGIGVSLAYFVGKTIFSGTGATTEARTATVNGSILDIEGTLEFDDLDMYPGHKKVSKITVTATGEDEFIAYNLIWQGINGLNTTLKYEVYKTTEEKEVSTTCTPKKKVTNGIQYLNEECNITGIEELGEKLNEGEIVHTEEETTIKITENQYITSKPSGEKVYYYVIIEYPNLTEEINKNQNSDIGHSFEGKVHAEISNKSADINILGIYIKDEETGKYNEAKEMPKEGYEINTQESQCTNGAIASTNYSDYSVNIKGLTLDGTSCYLYYDIYVSPSDKTLTKLGLEDASKGETPNFDKTTCSSGCEITTENGLYEAQDGENKSYYFRGTVNNNWVSFAGYYWRIIRINGDGSIRIIYNGTTNNQQDASTNAVASQRFAVKDYILYDDAKYVGFMYGPTNTSPDSTTVSPDYNDATNNSTSSNAKDQLDSWYISNLMNKSAGSGNKKASDYIDLEAGFCGDRTPYTETAESTKDASGVSSGYGKQKTYYGAYIRLSTNKTPTFDCEKENDLYTVINAKSGNRKLTNPIGLITADEIVYAGGKIGSNNLGYWLKTGANYWTMSPREFNGTYALVFYVNGGGGLDDDPVYVANFGMRPVINLKADITFKAGGTGEYDNPFVVQ